MLPTSLHPSRRSSRCYRTRLRTGCVPRTGLPPTFCLSPPQTSPVTPIVDFSYRASRNTGGAIAFRPGTGQGRSFYRPFLLMGETQPVWPVSASQSSARCPAKQENRNRPSSRRAIHRVRFSTFELDGTWIIRETYPAGVRAASGWTPMVDRLLPSRSTDLSYKMVWSARIKSGGKYFSSTEGNWLDGTKSSILFAFIGDACNGVYSTR